MKIFSVIILIISLFCTCKSNTSKKQKIPKTEKKKGILEEYNIMKSKLEPQGYIITTDSVDKIFIDHSVTINYNKKE